MWEMQILQKGCGAGDATDSEAGESGSSSHSADDNGRLRNRCGSARSTGECSPVHTKCCANSGTSSYNNQTAMSVSGITGQEQCHN